MTTSSMDRSTAQPLSRPDEVAHHVVQSLYACSAQAMFGFGRRLGLDDDEASDAVQETMLRLWRALRDGKVADPEAWAYRVLYRQAIDAHRLRRRLRLLGDRLRLGSDGSRGEAAGSDPAERSEVDAVWHEVDGLTERQRAVLYLRYRADLPYERIGLVLGVTPSAARSYATTGLAALRRRLGGEV